MKIIAGNKKGKKLFSGRNKVIRPTGAKTKEAIFNILQGSIQDKKVLDLFCGTGNLGIEALSRGAKYAVFVDSHPEAVKIVKKNLDICGFKPYATIEKKDVSTWLKKAETEYYGFFNLVFADPPYDSKAYQAICYNACLYNIIATNGIFIIEHRREKIHDPLQQFFWEKWHEKVYGDTVVSFFIPTIQEE